jgi:hypothetical protein
MNELRYILTGRVIPERALLNISEITLKVVGSEDVPEGELFVKILLNQIFARFVTSGEVQNIFTFRNIVEDAARMLVDVAGYSRGYACDVEIVQMMRSDTPQKQVYGIDVPALAGVCDSAGVTVNEILRALSKNDGNFLRHALSDAREAIKSPRDTGLFCYRAIESLKNCCAARKMISEEKDTWELFRTTYNISKQQILDVKAFADPVRHGNYVEARAISDQDRVNIFRITWEIINKFVASENANAVQADDTQCTEQAR